MCQAECRFTRGLPLSGLDFSKGIAKGFFSQAFQHQRYQISHKKLFLLGFIMEFGHTQVRTTKGSQISPLLSEVIYNKI